ncbi:MAG: DegT/DnrJ/EryC1/StrS family aminotransferase [Pseudomonadota bacterium]
MPGPWRVDHTETGTTVPESPELVAWRTAQQSFSPAEGARFLTVPKLNVDQPGYDYVLQKLAREESFAYAKVNHGIWERLVRLEQKGVTRHAFLTAAGCEIDRVIGIEGSLLAESGMLADFLREITSLPSPRTGMNFVPSLTPWPLADRIEGTPYESWAHCEALIGHFVPAEHLQNTADKRFSGHEFKVAAVVGTMAKFVDGLRTRDVILITNKRNRALFDATGIPGLRVIEIDARKARLERHDIRAQLFDALAGLQTARLPPVVVISAGDVMASWLLCQAFKRFARVHLIDVGGALAAYHPDTARAYRWPQIFRSQLAETAPINNNLHPALTHAYTRPFGVRDEGLVRLAAEAGVALPGVARELASPPPRRPIPFIENKVYDTDRMAEFLRLSIDANSHANGGPVASLLERAVAKVAGLPSDRRVVAVNSGTSALHLACAVHSIERGAKPLRWVTSAFTFFSSKVGPLSDAIVIDADHRGGFDLEALKTLPLSGYDGVIYTNTFAALSNWNAVAEYCHGHGKHFVVDNATGLADRPGAPKSGTVPIEAVSAHHTKPWSVGECGFVLCAADQEAIVRSLANFAATLPDAARPFASNFKISDVAAAAVLDRLERMAHLGLFYELQERRMHSLMIDLGLGIEPLHPLGSAKSPRTFSAFVSPHPVDVQRSDGPVTIRKYYRPLEPTEGGAKIMRARALFDRIFCLSNAPEMRLASNAEIIAQVRSMLENCAARTKH